MCVFLLCFVAIDDMQKDLDMDPKNSAELSSNAGEESEISTNATSLLPAKHDEEEATRKEETADSLSASASCLSTIPGLIQGDTTDTKKDESINTSFIEVDQGRKSSKRSKSNRGKVKGKVDWTPELHRQFVQAVEQLGVDNAVPSKILELMGIGYLSRHNVASHLQKYRSHQKHLLAREIETAKWSRRRQSFGSTGATGKSDPDSWAVPVTGFPPVTPRPHFRPLHTWGHPFVDQSYMYMWPQPPPIWASPQLPLPGDPSLWYYHQQDVTAPGIPCILPPFIPTGFPTPTVAGIPPTTISTVKALLKSPCDFNIPKESIDAVIGDVLSRPWLPLPLGLKPPSIECVITELQRQGISKITPSLPLKKRKSVLHSEVSGH